MYLDELCLPSASDLAKKSFYNLSNLSRPIDPDYTQSYARLRNGEITKELYVSPSGTFQLKRRLKLKGRVPI